MNNKFQIRKAGFIYVVPGENKFVNIYACGVSLVMNNAMHINEVIRLPRKVMANLKKIRSL